MKKDGKTVPFAVSGFMSDIIPIQSNILHLKYAINNQHHLNRHSSDARAMKASCYQFLLVECFGLGMAFCIKL